MADSLPWILISIVVLLIIVLLLFIVFRKRKKEPTNYYSLFIIGIMWIAIGLATQSYTFAAIGIIFVAMGLSKRKQWKKNREAWAKMSKNKKMLKLIAMVLLLSFFIAMLVVYILRA